MTAEQYKEEEKRVQEAYNAYIRGNNKNISALAREFNVPRKKLSRRLNGTPSRSQRLQPNTILSNDQEKALFLWLEYLDNIGAPPTNRQIEESANYLISKDWTAPGEPRYVDKMWIHRFLRRLPPGYERIKQRPQERERTDAEHYGVFERWFMDLRMTINDLRITPQNLWNFDETGFIVGRGKPEAVVTKHPKASKRVSSLSSRESITVVESINAEGKVIPPMLLPKGEIFLEEWTKHIKDPEWLVSPAPNGFINDEIAYEYIQHFHIHTQPKNATDWRLLLMDNHTSHLTLQFIQKCSEYRIQLFTFPPHSTHLLQPLDGVPFQQYKQVHGRVINHISKFGGFEVDKYDFFAELRDIRLQTFTERTIRHGWKERGIWPHNPWVVLDQLPHPEEAPLDDEPILKIYGQKDDTIPSSPTTKSISPPSSIQKLRRYINKMEQSIDGIKDILEEKSPGLIRRIKTINKGSLAIAGSGELHRSDFTQLREKAIRKNAPKTRRHVKVVGALYIKDANRLIKRRHDGDIDKIHKQYVLGLPGPGEEEAPIEPPPVGFFIDTTGKR